MWHFKANCVSEIWNWYLEKGVGIYGQFFQITIDYISLVWLGATLKKWRLLLESHFTSLIRCNSTTVWPDFPNFCRFCKLILKVFSIF